MKKTCVFTIALMLFASGAFTANFSPTPLRLGAPPLVHYDFDGENLSIPVTATGTPALAVFLVFTQGKAQSIVGVQNGYLGWHYVNKIDTCLYSSPNLSFEKGSNTVVWNGKDDSENQVAAGAYTYYLFAYDNVSPRQLVVNKITFYPGGPQNVITEKGPDGKPLDRPFIRNNTERWTLGNDPVDESLMETTSITLPTGWAIAGAGINCLQPNDYSNVFYQVVNSDAVLQGVTKFQWVPNGTAVQQNNWGDNGFATYSATPDDEPGVVTDGQFLYSGDSNHHLKTAASALYIHDFDGTMINKIDLTKWWSNPNDLAAGGQMNGGPNIFFERNGFLFLNCHCSCVKQMVNPSAENEDDFYVWTNRNGDYTLDHNFEENATNKWVCNDFNVGPYTYMIYADDNYFTMCPTYDLGAVSFGLMAPDGTGLGYFAYSGETAQQKSGNLMCQNGSSFDGIYSSKNESTGITSGMWYTGQDSFKGTISNIVGVNDAAPAAFAVAQNTPNPFNPTTTISFTLAKAGKTTVEVYNVAGQKVDTLLNAAMSAGGHSVVWNAAKFSAGVYFYTVKSGGSSQTKKMTLLK